MFFAVALFLGTIAFLYLFVFVDKKGKGVAAKIKVFLYDTIPAGVKAFLRKTCGEKAVWALDRMVAYTCYEANPAI